MTSEIEIKTEENEIFKGAAYPDLPIPHQAQKASRMSSLLIPHHIHNEA